MLTVHFIIGEWLNIALPQKLICLSKTYRGEIKNLAPSDQGNPMRSQICIFFSLCDIAAEIQPTLQTETHTFLCRCFNIYCAIGFQIKLVINFMDTIFHCRALLCSHCQLGIHSCILATQQFNYNII